VFRLAPASDGTSACCERITDRIGLAPHAGASNELLASTLSPKRIGFVTPYLDDVQDGINANYEKAVMSSRTDRICGLQTISRSRP